MSKIHKYPDRESLARAAAGHFVALSQDTIRSAGRFNVALSGGSTPIGMYSLLAQPELAEQVAWNSVHLYWGDERCLPPSHPNSNYRMAQHTLLDHVPIPVENIHRMLGELNPEQAAYQYEHVLRAQFPGTGRAGEDQAVPRFDLVLLGLGEDGHTASLFPGAPVLQENRRWVVAQYVDKLDSWRLSLTLLVINAAAHVSFLVSGTSKAEILKNILSGETGESRYPAQMVNPHDGELTWLVDEAAAKDL